MSQLSRGGARTGLALVPPDGRGAALSRDPVVAPRSLAAKRPAELAPKDAATSEKHSAWLVSCATRLDAAAGKSRAELLTRQQAMQNESRRFQTPSNIMKNQHQTAMSIIGNLR